MTFFTATLFPILLMLGNWQVERGAEKRGLENKYLAQLAGLPAKPSPAALVFRLKREVYQCSKSLLLYYFYVSLPVSVVAWCFYSKTLTNLTVGACGMP